MLHQNSIAKEHMTATLILSSTQNRNGTEGSIDPNLLTFVLTAHHGFLLCRFWSHCYTTFLASKLHNICGSCCTEELPYCPFAILWLLNSVQLDTSQVGLRNQGRTETRGSNVGKKEFVLDYLSKLVETRIN